MTHSQDEVIDLLSQAERELAGCRKSWEMRNAGRARVGARRSAGMAIRAWLLTTNYEGYGSNFMHHLAGLADDSRWPVALRESAWRLAARGRPESGFQAPLPDPLEPATDAESILEWCRQQISAGTGT